MLTRKQYDLLVFIEKKLRDTGVSPSYDEMKEALDLKSKSGIHRLISGLEERGYIRRLAHRARAVEVLRVPENFEEQLNEPLLNSRVTGSVEALRKQPGILGQPANRPGTSSDKLPDSEAVELPLYGKIAAGTPIEALSSQSESVDVPASMLGLGDHYALTVEGDSMVEAGINDGDTVLIQKTDHPENGSIVVALVDNEEATLKTMYRRGGQVDLVPHNSAYEIRSLPSHRVQFQGRLVGLMRRY